VEVLDGIAAVICNPAAAAEMVGMVESSQEFHIFMMNGFTKIEKIIFLSLF